MEHEFPAPHPLRVYVELRSGRVSVEAVDTDRATVWTDDTRGTVQVDCAGSDLRVLGRRRDGFGIEPTVDVRIVVPRDSTLVTKLGSASVDVQGPLRDARIATGSGDIVLDTVTGSTVVRSGSGSLIARSLGSSTHVKAGSASIRVGSFAGDASVVTGSGAIEVGRAGGRLTLKTGSGDLVVRRAEADARLVGTSGDLRVDRISRGRADLRNVTGDIILGIPERTPVWTDIRTTTGRVRSTLTPVGAPAEGQDYVEVRAVTVSGNVSLEPSREHP